MGRNQKVTAAEVKGYLEENTTGTNQDMSDFFKVSKPTIRSKVRELRNDGEPIIHGQDGLSLLNKEILKDPEKAKELVRYQDWILNVMKAMITGAKPVKPLLPAMRRSLMLNTTVEERRLIKQNSARMLALITLAEADEEMS